MDPQRQRIHRTRGRCHEERTREFVVEEARSGGNTAIRCPRRRRLRRYSVRRRSRRRGRGRRRRRLGFFSEGLATLLPQSKRSSHQGPLMTEAWQRCRSSMGKQIATWGSAGRDVVGSGRRFLLSGVRLGLAPDLVESRAIVMDRMNLSWVIRRSYYSVG